MTGIPGPHSLDEVRAALGSLTAAKIERFREVARYQLLRFPQWDPMELVTETAERFLDGRRTWPAGIPFDVVFYNALRSIAGEWRKDEIESPEMPVADLPPGGDGESIDIEVLAQGTPSYEAYAIAAQLVEKAFEHFKDDQDVEAVLFGRLTGSSAPETQADFAITAADYDAARKRLERWARGLDKKEGKR